jgi:hypothetical protein
MDIDIFSKFLFGHINLVASQNQKNARSASQYKRERINLKYLQFISFPKKLIALTERAQNLKYGTSATCEVTEVLLVMKIIQIFMKIMAISTMKAKF